MQQYLWILPSVSYGVPHEWWNNVIQWIFLKPEQQTIPKPCKMGTSEKQRQSLVGLLASGSAAWITKENKTIVRESYDRCKAKFSTVMEEERGFMVNNGRTTLNKVWVWLLLFWLLNFLILIADCVSDWLLFLQRIIRESIMQDVKACISSYNVIERLIPIISAKICHITLHHWVIFIMKKLLF